MNQQPLWYQPYNILRKPFYPIGQDQEIWQVISYPGVRPNSYLVSNYGRLYSLIKRIPKATRIWGKYVFATFMTHNNSEPITISMHRIVAYEFCEKFENKPYVNHIDGVPLNNYYSNLEWCTNQENILHAIDTGLNPIRGESHYNNKYDENLIRIICEYIVEGLSNIEVCRIFGFQTKRANIQFYGLVQDVKLKRGWTHISDLYF